MNYVILGILILIIVFYTQREGFTSEGKLTEYLNTWKATNDELQKSMIHHTNSMEVNKHINFPIEKGIKFGFTGNQTMDSNNWQGSIRATNDDGIHFSGTNDADAGNARAVKIWDNVHVASNLYAGNDVVGQHFYAGNFLKIDKHDGHNGSGILCITDNAGEVCIDADHLRMLKGEKELQIKNTHWGRTLDCGGWIKNASGSTGNDDNKPRNCYGSDASHGGNEQKFTLRRI